MLIDALFFSRHASYAAAHANPDPSLRTLIVYPYHHIWGSGGVGTAATLDVLLKIMPVKVILLDWWYAVVSLQ